MAKEYLKTNWENTPSTNTPINDENLNNIEDGIDGIDTKTQFQTAENKAVFNGVSSKADSGTFTSLDLNSIYFEFYVDYEIPNAANSRTMPLTFNNLTTDYLILNNASAVTNGIARLEDTSGTTEFITTNTYAAGNHKCLIRYDGTGYDLFIDGDKIAGDSNQTVLSATNLRLGARTNDSFWYDGDMYNIRFSSATITEAQALAITAGTTDVDTVLTTSNTELIYTDYDTTSTFDNTGTLGSAGDLTATNVIKGDITEFEGKAIIDNQEIGTWTPIITTTSTNATHTYATQIGNYIKTGNIIFITGVLRLSTLNPSATGNVFISGLPFPSGGFGRNGTINFSDYRNINLASTRPHLSGRIDDEDAILYTSGSNISETQLSVTLLSSTSGFTFSGTYILQ